MKIAIASGKGGTGKTTLSVALATYLDYRGIPVELVDCDVEEPNVNLFMKAHIEETETAYTLVPKVDLELCNGCGRCGELCQFSAIVLIKQKPMVFPDMCHSCGGCRLVCPERAIIEVEKEIGLIEEGSSGNIAYRGGRLNIGEAMSPPLIKEVKKFLDSSRITIIDSPPGTSCPVIESISGSDMVLLVTEPTPFGLNDLELAVAMVRLMDIPFGVIINRADIGDNRVENYCEREGITIVASIPNARKVAEGYSRGEFTEYFLTNYPDELDSIISFTGIDKSGIREKSSRGNR